MSIGDGSALVNRLFSEVFNQWNFAMLDQVFAQNFSAVPGNAEEGGVRGPEAAKKFFSRLRDAFPDLHYTVDDVVVEGDKVVARVHARGTHRGEYLGHPPTELPVEYSEMLMFRIVDGRIAEWWVEINQLRVLRQIGAIPAR
jgi:predicted ester cyclase